MQDDDVIWRFDLTGVKVSQNQFLWREEMHQKINNVNKNQEYMHPRPRQQLGFYDRTTIIASCSHDPPI